MKQLLSSYTGEHKSIFIVPIGDVHFGNKYFCRQYLDKALRFVQKNRQRTRVVLMGDLLELATKTSVGRGVYDEAYPTQRQFEMAVETFKPFADVIDCVLEGNHEERIIRDTSFEIVQELCHRLDRTDAYGKFSALVNYRLGSGLVYSQYAWHGASGGVSDAASLNALLAMRHSAVAHLYTMGHTHKLFHVNKKLFLPQIGASEPSAIEQLFVNTGAALSHGGYGEQKGYQPHRAGFGVVQLFSETRKMQFHYIDDLID